MLEIKKLDLNYEKHLLYSITGINLSEGDKLCVLGKNGVGKSTFLRALIFDKFKSNKIIINNKKSNDLSLLKNILNIIHSMRVKQRLSNIVLIIKYL